MSSRASQALSANFSNVALTPWPHCRLLGPSSQERCRRRLELLHQLTLFDCDRIPAFDEVTQQVAGVLQVPICIVTIADQAQEYVKAAYGLSHLGLGNGLVRLRQIPLKDGLGTYVLDCEHPFWVEDTGENPVIAASQLVYSCGIGSYGAVPLTTSGGQCIGTLAVMDLQPRTFTSQEISYMTMASRWGMSEYERCRVLSQDSPSLLPGSGGDDRSDHLRQRQSLIDAVRLHLIRELTQDLCSPLTAVLGMTSMLGQEIYGPLTQKQREYVDIVHNSSKNLMERVQDIVELGLFNPNPESLDFTPVDVAMLGQQVANTLTQLATQRNQTLSISTEPGERVWVLDRSIVKQILYHIVFSVMQLAGENSTIRVHASRKGQALHLAVWLSNPWLGDGLPQSVVRLCQAITQQPTIQEDLLPVASSSSVDWPGGTPQLPLDPNEMSPELLGLLLSQQLAECHGGYVKLLGSLDAGYRYVVVLPTGKPTSEPADVAMFTQA
jgi:hypothetical protein